MYCEAREAAGLTQRKAAERLRIGIRTLRGYEIGAVTPSPDMALAMSKLYRRPDLTVRYCRRECAIGQAYSYDPEITTLERGFLRLLKEFDDAGSRLRQELERVAQGEIGRDTLRELLELEHAIETLKLCAARAHDIAGMIREHNEEIKEKSAAVGAR